MMMLPAVNVAGRVLSTLTATLPSVMLRLPAANFASRGAVTHSGNPSLLASMMLRLPAAILASRVLGNLSGNFIIRIRGTRTSWRDRDKREHVSVGGAEVAVRS